MLSKLQGLQYYFPQHFSCNLKFYEIENSSDSSLHRNFDSENLRFPFPAKNSLTWRVKWEIVRNLLDKRQKLYMNETVI